jgi:DNA-binding response OmpR family regulator
MSGLAHASQDELEGRPVENPLPSVLIVDDDPDFQAAMAELVRGEGFTVETAGSLADAHAIFKVRIPDVVFVDLTLPDGNGLELLSAVEGPGAPVILIN